MRFSFNTAHHYSSSTVTHQSIDLAQNHLTELADKEDSPEQNELEEFHQQRSIGQTTHRFNIKFDYSLDQSGFFDPTKVSGQNARNALETAGFIWGSIIQDDFSSIPAKTEFDIADPSTFQLVNGQLQAFGKTVKATRKIDDIVIFVGAVDFPGDTRGASRVVTPDATSNTNLKKRLTSETNFEPWAGAITFDALPNGNDSWYFGATSSRDAFSKDKVDFITVALHEIGHVLGITEEAKAFDRLISPDGFFNGTQAKAVYGAQIGTNGSRTPQPVPLETVTEGTHLKLGLPVFQGERTAVMERTISDGIRKRLTVLDAALLQDIGYQISLIPKVTGDQTLPQATDVNKIQQQFTDIYNKELAVLKSKEDHLQREKIKTGLEEVLNTLQTEFAEDLSQKDLPIIGKLDSSQISTIFDDIIDRLSQSDPAEEPTLAQVQNLTGDIVKTTHSNSRFLAIEPHLQALTDDVKNDIRSALFTALQPALLDANNDKRVNAQDITVLDGDEPGDDLVVELKLGKNLAFDRQIASNLGIPGLGFNVSGNTKGSLDFAVDLRFGLNESGEFFFDTQKSDELTIGISSSIPNAKLNGKLGFLNLDATDRGSKIAGTIAVDLSEPPDPQDPTKDGKLTLSELGQLDFDPKLYGSANVNLDLDANLNGSVSLPSITSKFELSWNLGSKENPTPFSSALLGTAPTVKFKEVKLDLGEFITDFVQPVLNRVSSVTNTINSFIEPINTPLPILGISLIDVAKVATEIEGGTGDFEKSTIEFVNQLSDIIKLIESVPENPQVGVIDLGDFDLSTDVRTTSVSNSTVTPNIARKAPSVEDQLENPPLAINQTLSSNKQSVLLAALEPNFAASQDVISSIDKLKEFGNKYGLQFPLLDTPSSAFKLLLGQSGVDLFKYETPELGFDFRFEGYPPPTGIPIFGPITLQFGANVSAGAQLVFEFDSTGIQKTGNALDGFYVAKPDAGNNLSLGGGLEADVGVRGGIASASVGGGIGLDINFNISNPEDNNKIRGSTFDTQIPLCLFEPSGALSAIVFATLELDLGFFSFTKRINLVNENLIDFSPNTGDCDGPVDKHLNVKNPEPNAKVREFFRKQGIIDRRGMAGNDVITIASRSGGDSQDLRLTGLPPESDNANNEYDNVKLIVLYGDRGDDQITIATNVSSSISTQLYGEDGNDTLTGGKGVNFLSGGIGTNLLQGVGSRNTAVYADSQFGVEVNLVTGIGTDIAKKERSDTLRNIQNIEGSKFNDILTAIATPQDGRGSVLDAGEGNDILNGGTGDDVMLGGLGADFMDGAGGTDTTTYMGSTAAVYVNAANRDLSTISPITGVSIFLQANRGVGGEANGDRIFNIENIHGSIYDDILVASQGGGNLDGFLGNDLLFAGIGADRLDGGQGTNWLSYRLSTGAVNVSLAPINIFGNLIAPVGQGGYAEGDVIQIAKDQEKKPLPHSSFQNLEGSDFADTLTGDQQDNILMGLADNDAIDGREGNDTLNGGAGADTLDGGAHSDPTVFPLQALSNQVRGGGDVASYQDAPSGISVSLATGRGTAGEAAGDRLSDVENLLGSAQGDTLVGNNEANDINPGLQVDGSDVVDGGDGTDRLTVNYSLTRSTGTGAVGGFNTGILSRGNARVQFSNIERLYIVGTSKRDELVGGSKGDVLLTALGNDRVDGGLGRDIIRTDEGDDEVIDQLVNDQFVGNLENHKIRLEGGRGIDMLSVDLSPKGGNIQLIGTSPTQENLNQSLSFADGSQITGFEIFRKIKTGSGNDTLIQLGREFNGQQLNNVFDTGAGNDTVNPGLGIDVVDGGIDGLDPDGVLQGDDLLTVDYSTETTGTGVVIDLARDRFGGLSASLGGRIYRTVSETDQTLLDQVTFSNFERFNITGTDQSDRLFGGDGQDTLRGNAGEDRLTGNSGDDQLFGGDDKDFMIGGLGNDSLNGDRGDDLLIDGDDLFDNEFFSYPNGGSDTFSGGDGNDVLHSGIGNDQLLGEADDDRLFGDDGNDLVSGGSGNDTLAGAELFSSRDEIDTLTGGSGADVFVIGNEFGSFYFNEDSNGGTADYALITDFNPIEGDRIQIHQCHPGGYELRSTPEGLPAGIGIYAYANDLVAIVQGVSDLGELGFLDPIDRSNYFIAVGDCPS